MSYHVRLSSSYCLLCRHHIFTSEKTIAVLGTGSKYRGHTLSFDFPVHGHRFTYGTLYFDGRQELWRLCRYPLCPTCQRSPKAFALHTDCVNLLKKCVPTSTLLCTWLLSSWSYPGVYHDPPKPFTSLDSLARNMKDTKSTRHLRVILEKITRLPLEIVATIIDYSANSPLWRFATVLAWRLELFNCLRNETIKMLHPNALDCWIRGELGEEAASYKESINQSKHSYHFFRMSLDGIGIRSIQLFESRSALSNSKLPSSPWYIVEDIACLDDFDIESNGYFIRVEPRQSKATTLILWDTPSPPDLALCQIVENSESKPKRLRCVTLDDSLTGLSIFCAGGRTYGIHAHTRYYPSAVEAYQRILVHQTWLLWLYFPLARGEAIQEAWIRRRDGRGRISNPTLVVRTSCSRVCTFGLYVDLDDDEYKLCSLSNGLITQLVYDDPEPGNPILYFGASCRPAGNASQLGPLTQMKVCNNQIMNGQYFYSYASLEDVQHARLFFDRSSDEDQLRVECCIGILLTYSNRSQEVLGQCRIGLSPSIEILHPVTFHWQEVILEDNVVGANVRFSSEASKLEASGWDSKGMVGGVEWWFNRYTVIIDFKD